VDRRSERDEPESQRDARFSPAPMEAGPDAWPGQKGDAGVSALLMTRGSAHADGDTLEAASGDAERLDQRLDPNGVGRAAPADPARAPRRRRRRAPAPRARDGSTPAGTSPTPPANARSSAPCRPPKTPSPGSRPASDIRRERRKARSGTPGRSAGQFLVVDHAVLRQPPELIVAEAEKLPVDLLVVRPRAPPYSSTSPGVASSLGTRPGILTGPMPSIAPSTIISRAWYCPSLTMSVTE
jgi:hypothetical protein